MSRGAPLDVIATSLRRERERLGISLAELARRAGIAKSSLSQLESGTGNPGIETLWALAVALGVPFSRIVDPVEEPVQVIRAGEGAVLHAEQAPFAATLLSTCPPGVRRDLHVMQADPGASREAHSHITGTTEHVIVISGRWRVGPTDEAVDVGPGDYVRFPGDRPHTYSTQDADASAVLVMEYR